MHGLFDLKEIDRKLRFGKVEEFVSSNLTLCCSLGETQEIPTEFIIL